jgi:hypothetical protein
MEQLRIGYRIEEQTVLAGEGSALPSLYEFGKTLRTNLYYDITSNYNWLNIGQTTYDFNFCRNQISILTSTAGWSGLTTEEKKVAAQVFVVDKPQRDEVLTENEQFNFWGDLVRNSQTSRFKRWEAAKNYISYNLSPINASDLGKSTSELCNDYINYNIITLVKDGISGLFDYLKGEGDFVGSGFPSKAYWTQTLQENLLDILENGNY